MRKRSFEVLELLGKGGFGSVYRAMLRTESGMTKVVALKVLHPDMEQVEEFARRMRDEARILGLVRHRAIVHVEDLLQMEGRWVLVEEYVEGLDLAEILLSTTVPVNVALDILAEVAAALHAAHQAQGPDGRPLRLIHRDIKPANIRLSPLGEVKILDFGIARADFDDREAKTRSLTFGSRAYMAPERLDLVDLPEGDVYSMGVVAYEIIMGERFGAGFANRDRHQDHVRASMESLSHALGVEWDLVGLIASMLAHAPSERPSAREVERRLSALRQPGTAGLHDWAEELVPSLMSQRSAPPPDSLVSRLIVDDDSAEQATVQMKPASERALARDGEKRSEPPQAPTPATLPYPPPASPSRARALWAALLLVPAGAAALWFLSSREETSTPESPLAEPLPAPPSHLTQVTPEEPPPSPPLETTATKAPRPGRREGTRAPEALASPPVPEPIASPSPLSPADEVEKPIVVVMAEPPMASVRFIGGAQAVSLSSSGGRSWTLPARVPAGSYKIEADFPEKGKVIAGRVTVPASGEVLLDCADRFGVCRASSGP